MAHLMMERSFERSVCGLSPPDRQRVEKAITLLMENPGYPSLQTKRLKGARRRDIYEARVDQGRRLIFRRDAGGIALLLVGDHEEAIRYGLCVKEPEVQYETGDAHRGGIAAYIAGEDAALDLVPLQPAILARWRDAR